MKIMAICGSGLGSSFMVEMNIKKVLKKLEIEAEVEHSDLPRPRRARRTCL